MISLKEPVVFNQDAVDFKWNKFHPGFTGLSVVQGKNLCIGLLRIYFLLTWRTLLNVQ
jgi:hypothetical protein